MKFCIYGLPCAKGRPRFRNRGKFVQTYTDDKTENYENLVKLAYIQAKTENDFEMISGGFIEIEIIAYFPVPKSCSKKQLKQIEKFPAYNKRPDFDNVGKIVCDALNKVAFADDCLIFAAHIYKWYTFDEPRVEVCMKQYVYEQNHNTATVDN